MLPSPNWLLVAILVILAVPSATSFSLSSEINLLKKKLDSKIELNPYFLDTWERIEKFNGTKCSFQQGPHCSLFSPKQTSSQLPLENSQDSLDVLRIKKYLLSKMRDLATKADREYGKQHDTLPSSYYIDKQRAILDEEMFYYPAEKNVPIKLLIDFDALETVWPKDTNIKGISPLQMMYSVDIDFNSQQVVQKETPVPRSSLKLEFSGISAVQMKLDYSKRDAYFDRISYLQSKPFNIAIESSKDAPGIIMFNMPVRIVSFYAKVTAKSYEPSPMFNIRGKTSTSQEVYSQNFKQTVYLYTDQFQLFTVSSSSPVQILQFSNGLLIDNIIVEIDRKNTKKSLEFFSQDDQKRISQKQADRPDVIMELLTSGMDQIVSKTQQENKGQENDRIPKVKITKEKRQQMREEYMILLEIKNKEAKLIKEETSRKIKEQKKIDESFSENTSAVEKKIKDIIGEFESNPAQFLEKLIQTSAESLDEKDRAKINELIAKYKREDQNKDSKGSQPYRFREKDNRDGTDKTLTDNGDADDDNNEDIELQNIIKSEVDNVFANLHENLNSAFEQLEQLKQQSNQAGNAGVDLLNSDRSILDIFNDFNKNVENIQNKYEDKKTGLGQKKEKQDPEKMKNTEKDQKQQQQQGQIKETKQQQQQHNLKNVKELVSSMTMYFSFNELSSMKYPQKIIFAEDWLFLSRLIIFKLLNMQDSWELDNHTEAEIKVIEIVLTGFQEITEYPSWMQYKKLKETQTYGKDADENTNSVGTDYGVEERFNILGALPVLAKHSIFGKLDQHYAQFALRISLEYLSNILYDSVEETDTSETLSLKLMTFLETSIEDTLIKRMLRMLVPSSVRSVRSFYSANKLREADRQGLQDGFEIQDRDIVTFYNLAVGKMSLSAIKDESSSGKGSVIFDQFLRVALHLFKEFRKFKEQQQKNNVLSEGSSVNLSEKDKKREFNAFVTDDITKLLKQSKTLREQLSEEEISSKKISVKAISVFWTVLDPIILIQSYSEDGLLVEDAQDEQQSMIAYEEQEKLIESVLDMSLIIPTENLYYFSLHNIKETSDIIRLSLEEGYNEGEVEQEYLEDKQQAQRQSINKEDL